MNGELRRWQVLKLADDDYAAFGVMIEGPRCEDETLVSLRDVVDILKGEPLPSGARVLGEEWVGRLIEREFGGNQT